MKLKKPTVLMTHIRAGGGKCWRSEADPVTAEAGHQIGWKCRGCETPFGLRARQIRVKYRGLTLEQIRAGATPTLP